MPHRALADARLTLETFRHYVGRLAPRVRPKRRSPPSSHRSAADALTPLLDRVEIEAPEQRQQQRASSAARPQPIAERSRSAPALVRVDEHVAAMAQIEVYDAARVHLAHRVGERSPKPGRQLAARGGARAGDPGRYSTANASASMRPSSRGTAGCPASARYACISRRVIQRPSVARTQPRAARSPSPPRDARRVHQQHVGIPRVAAVQDGRASRAREICARDRKARVGRNRHARTSAPRPGRSAWALGFGVRDAAAAPGR